MFKINADAEGLFLQDIYLQPVGDIVEGDLLLAGVGLMGSGITWESSDPSSIAIAYYGTIGGRQYYVGDVSRDENDNKTVTLTATLTLGDYELTRYFIVTLPPKEPLMAVASDAHVPLDADGRTPQAAKNYWLVSITNSNSNITVKNNISEIYGAVIEVPGTWPDAGFSYSVQKESDRVIRITLEDLALSPITQTAEVQFIITPLAVNNGDGFKNSYPVTVYIDPPGGGSQQIIVDTASSDLNLKLQAGNTQPDSADNSWVLKISEPLIKAGVSPADLEITGLPDGLNVQNIALDQAENSIIITVAGTASQPVLMPVNVGIVVKGSAASESDYEDSIMATAVIEPYDQTPPALQQILVDDGNLVFLNYDEELDETSIPAAGDFTVTLNGNTATVSQVDVANGMGIGQVQLTLSENIYFGDTVVVSYTPGTNTDKIKNISGLAANSFSNEAADVDAVSSAAVYFTDPTALVESGNDDGTINDNTITVTIERGILVSDFGTQDVTAYNLPDGLSYTVNRLSDTAITITITGAAASHGSANSVTNLYFMLDPARIRGGDNNNPSLLRTNNISINFVN